MDPQAHIHIREYYATHKKKQAIKPWKFIEEA